jgi:hypothetical protein
MAGVEDDLLVFGQRELVCLPRGGEGGQAAAGEVGAAPMCEGQAALGAG